MPAADLIRHETEAGFLRAVIRLARLHGWRCYHQRPAWTRKGARTALQGDKGFPDLVLVHRKAGRLIVAELKVGRNDPTPEQEDWLTDLKAAGVAVRVWWPSEWAEIEATLRT